MNYFTAQATYPQAWPSRPQALAYLVLLRMEVAAFHPALACAMADSSLWPCSSPHGARPLAGIPLCGARTFLQSPGLPPRSSGCLADSRGGFYSPACFSNPKESASLS